jgi:hypothetical protein
MNEGFSFAGSLRSLRGYLTSTGEQPGAEYDRKFGPVRITAVFDVPFEEAPGREWLKGGELDGDRYCIEVLITKKPEEAPSELPAVSVEQDEPVIPAEEEKDDGAASGE